MDKKVTIEGKQLKLTNLEKIYWPEKKYTKGDLCDYYFSVADYILPYLKDKPESLNRFPNGIGKESFYQKNVDENQIPQWIKTEKIYSESEKKEIRYLLCQDKATLVYMANLGCIEINPWNSRVSHLDHPDYMIIDLDPENISFKEVIKTAKVTKEVFDELKINAFPKTSGMRGIHIYIPMGAKYNYNQIQKFGKVITHLIHQKIPQITSLERDPDRRQKKVYLDYLQNARGQTVAAPYSIRPTKEATVSAPLKWAELDEKLRPENFTLKNIKKRLREIGDIFKPVLKEEIDIKEVLKTIESQRRGVSVKIDV